MSTKPPHPPDEKAEELRAVLARNHPELTAAQLDALLAGEPKRRRRPNHIRLENRGRRETAVRSGSAPSWAVGGAIARSRRHG